MAIFSRLPRFAGPLLFTLVSFGAQGPMLYVNFESGLTVPLGAPLGVGGSAYSENSVVTNISVSVGGVKLGEETFNERNPIFGIYVTNTIPGRHEIAVTARDAAGGVSVYGGFTVYYPSRLGVRLISPESTNATVLIGSELKIRVEPEIDIGDINGVFFWFDYWNEANTNRGVAPYELTWRPTRPGVFPLSIGPWVDVPGEVGQIKMNLTALPVGLPVITQQTIYYDTPEGGRRMFIESYSRGEQKFQWLHNGQPIPGATNATYVIEKPQASDDGYYSAQVDNFAGRIVSDMIDQAFEGNGGGRILFANHTGEIDAPLHSPGQVKEWGPHIQVLLLAGERMDRMRAVTPWINVDTNGYFDAGAISLPQIAAGQKAYVQVVAKDELPLMLETGLRGQSRILEIIAGAAQPTPLTGLEGFTLVKYGPHLVPRMSTNNPASLKQGGSGELKLSMFASEGVTNITYQWSKNSIPIPGATNDTLQINNVQRIDAAYYTVFVTDGTLWNRAGASLGIEDSASLSMRADSQLVLRGNASSRYTLETSSDLKSWSPWRSVESAGDRLEIPAAPPASGNVFYRAVVEP
jgi:hypothetical protein